MSTANSAVQSKSSARAIPRTYDQRPWWPHVAPRRVPPRVLVIIGVISPAALWHVRKAASISKRAVSNWSRERGSCDEHIQDVGASMSGSVRPWVTSLKGFRFLLLNPSPHIASPFPRLRLAHLRSPAVRRHDTEGPRPPPGSQSVNPESTRRQPRISRSSTGRRSLLDCSTEAVGESIDLGWLRDPAQSRWCGDEPPCDRVRRYRSR